MNCSITSPSSRNRKPERTICFSLSRLRTDPHFKHSIILEWGSLSTRSMSAFVNTSNNFVMGSVTPCGMAPSVCSAVEISRFSFRHALRLRRVLTFCFSVLRNAVIFDSWAFISLRIILRHCVNSADTCSSTCGSAGMKFIHNGSDPSDKTHMAHQQHNWHYIVFLPRFFLLSFSFTERRREQLKKLISMLYLERNIAVEQERQTAWKSALNTDALKSKIDSFPQKGRFSTQEMMYSKCKNLLWQQSWQQQIVNRPAEDNVMYWY